MQAERANALSKIAGLDSKCKYQVADALEQPFQDKEFDLVWSLESGEHMPDKRKFVGELLRIAKPGGRVMIVTWCHRNLRQGEAALGSEEQAVLNRVNEAYYLPPWCSLSDYEKLFGAALPHLHGACHVHHLLKRSIPPARKSYTCASMLRCVGRAINTNVAHDVCTCRKACRSTTLAGLQDMPSRRTLPQPRTRAVLCLQPSSVTRM